MLQVYESPETEAAILVDASYMFNLEKKQNAVLTQFGYFSFLLLVSWTQWSPTTCFRFQTDYNLIWISRTLVNVMEEYFPNEIVQSCVKQHETEVIKTVHLFFQCNNWNHNRTEHRQEIPIRHWHHNINYIMPQFTNMHSLQTCKSIATEVTAEVMKYFSALPQIIEYIFELCNKYLHMKNSYF